ncbi:hypothetical protein ACLB2K_045429 [Fragaria x ananassa]
MFDLMNLLTFFQPSTDASQGEWFGELFLTPLVNELAADIHSSQDIVQPLVNIDEVHEMKGHQHEEASQPSSPRRYPARVYQPPSRFGKYVGYSSRYPLELGLQAVSSSHSAFLNKILTETELRNFVEANQETFAHVAKMNTVRVLLYVAMNVGWSLYQMDVENAFLHRDLEEDVYTRIPPSHPRVHEVGMVCNLMLIATNAQ